MKTKICEKTGKTMYKTLCCGGWVYDIEDKGICQPCWEGINEDTK
jgi:urocanate hydratase